MIVVVRAYSAGYDAGKDAKVTVNDIEVPMPVNENKNYRGLHIVIINTQNCRVEIAQVFDTYETSSGMDFFI